MQNCSGWCVLWSEKNIKTHRSWHIHVNSDVFQSSQNHGLIWMINWVPPFYRKPMESSWDLHIIPTVKLIPQSWISRNPHRNQVTAAITGTVMNMPARGEPSWQGRPLSKTRKKQPYSYGHLSVITGYKWDYTFYKWGFVSTYNW